MAIIILDGGANHGRELLGGKAWSIQRMLGMGIAVPPAFVLSTDECGRYFAAGGKLPDGVTAALPAAMNHLETVTRRKFARGPRPLLVSVRSGAPVSMPGMMDTVLNLGLTPEVEHAMGREATSAVFAADTRRRFEQQYRDVVGHAPDPDPWRQLEGAICAVFDSWHSRRATVYRAERGIDDGIGTAVTVQAMVFGNLDERSGTGVVFTRNPSTGAAQPFGEWLPQAQGEDVVSGSHDALPLATMAERMPAAHAQLIRHAQQLETAERDMQDIEFTVESGQLWLLQSRAAKRSAVAAVHLAVTLQREGLITSQEAVARVSADQLKRALQPHIEATARATARVLARGKPASPGIRSGLVVCSNAEAEDRADAGEAVVLARPTTDPEDMPAMMGAAAVITELGGATSHAAVVSRELGIPCIVGCGVGTVTTLGKRQVTVDAESGEVFDGALPIVTAPAHQDDVAQLAEWAAQELARDASLTH